MHDRSVNFGTANAKNELPIYDKIKETITASEANIYEATSNQAKIQVEILPQDDNWGENTAVTCGPGDNFSDFNDDQTEDGRSTVNYAHSKYGNEFDAQKNTARSFLKHYFGYICVFVACLCSFLTPILFIVLPRVSIQRDWHVDECGLECEGLLIGIAFKLCILLLGNWAVFARKPRARLPRIYELRALIVLLLCLVTFSYWLFYSVRIIQANVADYYKILQFTVSLVQKK